MINSTLEHLKKSVDHLKSSMESAKQGKAQALKELSKIDGADAKEAMKHLKKLEALAVNQDLNGILELQKQFQSNAGKFTSK